MPIRDDGLFGEGNDHGLPPQNQAQYSSKRRASVIVTLSRLAHMDYGVLGELTCPGFQCYTLEPPWLSNRVSQSCVPEGVYDVRPDQEGRFTGHPELQAVPGRTEIVFHEGNVVANTEGCILVGEDYTISRRQIALTSSAAAYRRLIDVCGTSFVLDIQVRHALHRRAFV